MGPALLTIVADFSFVPQADMTLPHYNVCSYPDAHHFTVIRSAPKFVSAFESLRRPVREPIERSSPPV